MNNYKLFDSLDNDYRLISFRSWVGQSGIEYVDARSINGIPLFNEPIKNYQSESDKDYNEFVCDDTSSKFFSDHSINLRIYVKN